MKVSIDIIWHGCTIVEDARGKVQSQKRDGRIFVRTPHSSKCSAFEYVEAFQ